MRKKCVSIKNISRQSLSNPNNKLSFHERQVSSKSIDIKNNSIIKDYGNGFIKVVVKDSKKLIK